MKALVIISAAVIALTGPALAGKAAMAANSAPTLMTDAQMDQVVAGEDASPGLILIDTQDQSGATLLTAVRSGDYPPPVVIVDGVVENR